VKDPIDELGVSARRAVITTGVVLGALVVLAILRPSTFWTIVVVFAFLFMIVLHELGHFLTAKKTGMKASEFFLGFGPRLWSTRRGETEYGVKAFPLGGYVKILGMTNLEEVAPHDEPRTYRSKGYGAKLLVASAGSAMHFLVAGVLMFTVLLFAGDLPGQYPVPTVAEVARTEVDGETVGPAADAGIRAGDVVRSVDGVAVETWRDMVDAIAARPGETVPFVVERDGSLRTLRVALADEHPARPGERVGYAGIAPTIVTPDITAVEAAVKTPGAVWDVATESVRALGSIFSPSGISEYLQTVSGENDGTPEEQQRFISPVGFTRVANQAVNSGWVAAFGLLIAINVFVGIFNLIPLLPFDGGHIAIATYEAVASRIRGRRVVVDVNKLMPLTVGVIGILGFIFLSSLFLDVSRPIENPF
jgi:membrane-associated protease RseP (regulator of RpoE activity)